MHCERREVLLLAWGLAGMPWLHCGTSPTARGYGFQIGPVGRAHPLKAVEGHTSPIQCPLSAGTLRVVTVRPIAVSVVSPACGDPLRGSASAVPDHSPTPRGTPREWSGTAPASRRAGAGKPSGHPSPQPPGFPK